jgi:hypothetical protein
MWYDELVLFCEADRDAHLGAQPFAHTVRPNFLPAYFASLCLEEIERIEPERWDRLQNPFEHKHTLRDKRSLPPGCAELFEYLDGPTFLASISGLCGTTICPDPTRNWWGVHVALDGDFLDVHCDAGVHPITGQKKHVTVGLYLSVGWTEENGGHLELWCGDPVTCEDCVLHYCAQSVYPAFNTLVVFNNTDVAWHGSPRKVRIPSHDEGTKRIFLTLSYLSKTMDDPLYSNRLMKAKFVKLPNDDEDDEEKATLRKLRSHPERCQEVYRVTISQDH